MHKKKTENSHEQAFENGDSGQYIVHFSQTYLNLDFIVAIYQIREKLLLFIDKEFLHTK